MYLGRGSGGVRAGEGDAVAEWSRRECSVVASRDGTRRSGVGAADPVRSRGQCCWGSGNITTPAGRPKCCGSRPAQPCRRRASSRCHRRWIGDWLIDRYRKDWDLHTQLCTVSFYFLRASAPRKWKRRIPEWCRISFLLLFLYSIGTQRIDLSHQNSFSHPHVFVLDANNFGCHYLP